MSFEEAKEVILMARLMADDLPDGMAETVKEAWQAFREDHNRPAFIEDIETILSDWGFSF